MIQPQGDDVVQRIEAQLRQLSPELRIRWNPTARFRTQSHWDVSGKRIVDEEYEGRWQVVRSDYVDRNNADRIVVIWTVEFDGEREGEYRELGDWLVEFFRKWDSANAAFRDTWEKEWQEHDALLERARKWQDEGAALEGLDKMWVGLKERHTNYPGRGADFNE